MLIADQLSIGIVVIRDHGPAMARQVVALRHTNQAGGRGGGGQIRPCEEERIKPSASGRRTVMIGGSNVPRSAVTTSPPAHNRTGFSRSGKIGAARNRRIGPLSWRVLGQKETAGAEEGVGPLQPAVSGSSTLLPRERVAQSIERGSSHRQPFQRQKRGAFYSAASRRRKAISADRSLTSAARGFHSRSGQRPQWRHR